MKKYKPLVTMTTLLFSSFVAFGSVSVVKNENLEFNKKKPTSILSDEDMCARYIYGQSKELFLSLKNNSNEDDVVFEIQTSSWGNIPGSEGWYSFIPSEEANIIGKLPRDKDNISPRIHVPAGTTAHRRIVVAGSSFGDRQRGCLYRGPDGMNSKKPIPFTIDVWFKGKRYGGPNESILTHSGYAICEFYDGCLGKRSEDAFVYLRSLLHRKGDKKINLSNGYQAVFHSDGDEVPIPSRDDEAVGGSDNLTVTVSKK